MQMRTLLLPGRRRRRRGKPSLPEYFPDLSADHPAHRKFRNLLSSLHHRMTARLVGHLPAAGATIARNGPLALHHNRALASAAAGRSWTTAATHHIFLLSCQLIRKVDE